MENPAQLQLKDNGMSHTSKIDYTVQIWREGNQFIAHAMPLDVMSAGLTPEQARAAVDEAVALFIRTASDLGTLEDVLREAGLPSPERKLDQPVLGGG